MAGPLTSRAHAVGGEPSESRRLARLGVALLGVTTGVTALTVWFLPLSRTDRVHVTLLSVVVVVVAVAGLALPWDRLRLTVVLLHAVLTFAYLGVLGLMTTGVASTYGTFVVFAFVYAGLVGSTAGVLALLPLGAGTWLLANDAESVGISTVSVIRLSIAVSLWVTVGLVVARRSAAQRRDRSHLVGAAQTDVLTGLDNRRVLAGALRGAASGDAVVVIDIDGFREVNSTRGHPGGDTVLAEFGRVARVGLRGTDRAVRQGGDEFVFVLTAVSQVEVLSVLGRLRGQWQDSCGPVSFSAGAAVLGPEETGEQALARADGYCYRAKSSGRDQWVLDADEPGADEGPLTVVPVAAVGDGARVTAVGDGARVTAVGDGARVTAVGDGAGVTAIGDGARV